MITIMGRNNIAANAISQSFDVRGMKYATAKKRRMTKKILPKNQRIAFIINQPFLLDHTVQGG